MPAIAASLTPLPGRPTLTFGDGVLRVDVDLGRVSLAIAAWTCGALTFGALTTTIA